MSGIKRESSAQVHAVRMFAGSRLACYLHLLVAVRRTGLSGLFHSPNNCCLYFW